MGLSRPGRPCVADPGDRKGRPLRPSRMPARRGPAPGSKRRGRHPGRRGRACPVPDAHASRIRATARVAPTTVPDRVPMRADPGDREGRPYDGPGSGAHASRIRVTARVAPTTVPDTDAHASRIRATARVAPTTVPDTDAHASRIRGGREGRPYDRPGPGAHASRIRAAARVAPTMVPDRAPMRRGSGRPRGSPLRPSRTGRPCVADPGDREGRPYDRPGPGAHASRIRAAARVAPTTVPDRAPMRRESGRPRGSPLRPSRTGRPCARIRATARVAPTMVPDRAPHASRIRATARVAPTMVPDRAPMRRGSGRPRGSPLRWSRTGRPCVADPGGREGRPYDGPGPGRPCVADPGGREGRPYDGPGPGAHAFADPGGREGSPLRGGGERFALLLLGEAFFEFLRVLLGGFQLCILREVAIQAALVHVGRQGLRWRFP